MLSFDEASVVSGGDDCELDEVVVTGKRPAPPQIYAQAFDYCSWAPSGGGGGWGGGGLDEVVITGKRVNLLDYMTFDQLAAALSKDWQDIKTKWGEIVDFFDRENSEEKPKALSEMSDEERLQYWEGLMKELSPTQRAALSAALLAAANNGTLSAQAAGLAAMAGAISVGNGAEAAAWHGHIIASGGGPTSDSVLDAALGKARSGS